MDSDQRKKIRQSMEKCKHDLAKRNVSLSALLKLFLLTVNCPCHVLDSHKETYLMIIAVNEE